MTNEIHDDAARRRYELAVGEEVAFIDYRRDGAVVTLTHAEVPPALRGGGIGKALVAAALALVRERNEQVVPLCPFIAHYMQRHPETQDLLAGNGAAPRRRPSWHPE